MDRRGLPEVWDVLRGSPPPPDSQHVHQSQRNQELLSRWCDRSAKCERPRTYDKFYAKTPGNFHDVVVITDRVITDSSSAASLCSSQDEEDQGKSPRMRIKGSRGIKGGRRELQYSRTLTERDVRHLERHLSMKKTIRKKIMRDLQQAFVEDPQQFARAESATEATASEASAAANASAELSLNFDPRHHHKNEQRFLDLLRDSCSDDSGLGSPRLGRLGHADAGGDSRPAAADAADGVADGAGNRQGRHKFRSVRARPKPRYAFMTDSSDDCSEGLWTGMKGASGAAWAQEDCRLAEATGRLEVAKKGKRTFWQILTGRNKEKKRK